MAETSTKLRRRDDLDPAVWQRYLALLIRRIEGEPARVNGHTLTDTQTRAVFRWLREETAPSVFVADTFLCSVGLHLSELFLWADEQNLQPWACGAAPEWWEAEGEDEASAA